MTSKREIKRRIGKLEAQLEEEQQDTMDVPETSSVLTTAQRDLLSGEKDVTPASYRAMRSRIRDRCVASVYDLNLLLAQQSVGSSQDVADELNDSDIEGAIRYLEELAEKAGESE